MTTIRTSMRLKAILIPLLAFLAAGIGALYAASFAAVYVEKRSVIAVQEELADDGHTWASVQVDGLQVIIEGEAPTEVTRFQAITAAGRAVDASRVIDLMSVADAEQIAPPDFAVEIMRNDTGITLFGLIPGDTDLDLLLSQINDIAGDQPVADFLDLADYPRPEGWTRAMDFAITALDDLPRSKLSIAAGRVEIIAITDSEERQRNLEAQLVRTTPDNVTVDLSISAPRPVITPFTIRFIRDDLGTRFDACAADTEEAQSLILAAAIEAGASAQTDCPLGLGVPTATWGTAVASAISAVDAMGGGTLTISDADITLVAPLGTPEGQFNDVIGELTNTLPDVFVLASELPQPEEESDAGPIIFNATLSPEGDVQLRGQVPDPLMNTTAENFARAKFGNLNVTMRTRITDDLPRGWSVRVLAAIEALSLLTNGAVIVEPEFVSIRGNTGDPDASATISRLMIDKLGAGAAFELDVTYVEALDPIAGLPTPEECVAQIIAQTSERKITFDPGSTELSAGAQPIIDDIAEIFRRCPDLEIEIAGFTDSQGRDVMNTALSQDRANAVLAALRLRRIPVATLRAVGYGEEQPIADNDTEEGREANRRIEFRLIEPEVVEEELTGLEAIEAEAEAEDAETTEETAEDGTEDSADE